MKKSMILVTAFALICTLLLGCTNPAMPTAVAERLEYSLNALQNTIKNWDTIDNGYLKNPDISPVVSAGITLTTKVAPPVKNSFGKLATIKNLALNLVPHSEVVETLDQVQTTAFNNAEYETSVQNNETLNTNFHNNFQGVQTYTPRRVNNDVFNKNDQALDSYISKVNNLYTMTNDTVEANNLLEDSKNTLSNCITELRELAIKMKEGNYTPSAQQITALNNYITEIRATITKIRGTNGHLNNEINKINNHDKEGLTTSIDVLNSNYIRILNHIDIRITYLKNALATLEQVKSLLLEAQMLNTLELESVENDFLNGKLINNNHSNEDYNNSPLLDNAHNYDENKLNNYEPQHFIDDNEITNSQVITEENSTPFINDTEKESDNKIENITENLKNNNENSSFNTNSEQLVENDNEKEIFNNNSDIIINNDNLNNTGVSVPKNEHDSQAIKPAEPIVINDNIHNSEKESEGQNGSVNYEIVNDVRQDNINIDTYENANIKESNEILNRQRAMRNVDTYNPPEINSRKRNDNFNVENIENSNENLLNNSNNRNNNVGATPAPNLPSTALPNNGGVANNGSMMNGGFENGMTQNDINTPNGTFQNGIITQNNLNESVNNGINGVRTGYNGSTNSPYTMDSDGKMRNINTYGHNTLIDIINRGTVNNGINTLSFSPYGTSATNKPNMVNSNEINPQAYMKLNPTYVEKVLA